MPIMMASQAIPDGSEFEQELFLRILDREKKVESNRVSSSNRKMLTSRNNPRWVWGYRSKLGQTLTHSLSKTV
jgi:hypothetical protein